MIKAMARGKDGRALVVLGITDRNIEKMREGLPIHVMAEEVGLSNFTFYIITGKDEAALQATLGPLLHPIKTEIRDHRKQPKN